MNEVWMIDYLNAVFPGWGVFPSEGHVQAWLERHIPEDERYRYKPFRLTVNHRVDMNVPTDAPFSVYRNQR